MKINDKELNSIIQNLSKQIQRIKKTIKVNKQYLDKKEIENLSNQLKSEMTFEEEFKFFQKNLLCQKLKFKKFGKWYEEPLYKIGRIYSDKETFINNDLNTQTSYKKDDLIISLNKTNYLEIKYAENNGILMKDEIKIFPIFCYKDFILKYFDFHKNDLINAIFYKKKDYVDVMKGIIYVPEIEEQEQIAIFLDILEFRHKIEKHI